MRNMLCLERCGKCIVGFTSEAECRSEGRQAAQSSAVNCRASTSSPSISPQVTVYKAGEDEAAGVGDVLRVVVISHLRCENHSKNGKPLWKVKRPVVIVKNNLQCFRLVSIQLFCVAVITGDLFPSIGAPM